MLANRTLQATSGGLLYQILKSLRFRSDAGAYLGKTFSAPTGYLKYTLSFWVKRGGIGSSLIGMIMSAGPDASNYDIIYFNGDSLSKAIVLGGVVYAQASTSALFRDPSAWYHVVVVFDSNNATANDRTIIYVNSVRQALSANTPPALGGGGYINYQSNNYIGVNKNNVTTPGQYFDGYISEMYFVDGQALDATSFGQFDPVSGVWSAKRYIGTYGNNGFYLDFNDTSSVEALGYDKQTTSRTFSTAGTYSFTVPSYSTSLVVKLWGGGGGGGGGGSTFGNSGSNGTASTFSTLSAGGGGGGTGAWTANPTGVSGAGGTATGGDTNTNGNSIATSNGATTGAGAPNGGGNTATATANAEHYNGTAPGGAATGGRWAGAGNPTGGAGGSGAYVQKTYAVGALTPGAVITVTVGGGGAGGASDADQGATGASGRVMVAVDGGAVANDWTPTNISLVSDPTYDSMTDVPLGSGGYESTIYPSLNPLDKHAYVTLSNNNLTVTGNTSTDSGPVTATVGAKTGKYYWETTIVSAGSGLNYAGIGIGNAQNATSAEAYSIASGATAGAGIRSAAGGFNVAYGGYGSYSGATLPGFTTGDIIGVALDLDNGALYFHKNGVWMNTSVPTSGATRSGAFIYWTPGAITARPATGGYNGSIATLNFGQTSFAYTPPTGFGVLKTTANGRGNYATLLPSASSTAAVISAANLSVTTAAASSSNFFKATASISVSSGKWYWESTVGSLTTNNWGLNISGTPPVVDSSTNQNGQLTGEVTYIAIDGSGTPQEVITVNGSVAYTVASTVINGNVVAVAFDADARTVQFYRQNIAVGPAQTINTATLYYISAMVRNNTLASIHYVNFGQRPFIYTPPTGFLPLHTGNFSVPTIRKPNQYFDATLYTGTSATQGIINSGAMQPDLVWIKHRSDASHHRLYDSVRGVVNVLFSSLTSGEFVAPGDGIAAMNSNGFTLEAGANVYNYNNTGQTYIAWQWRAGGAAVTNTAGTITSQVSANTTSGFSIVTYTGNGVAGSTIGHGIGVAPALIIVKTRSGASSWFIRHSSVGTGYLSLDSTNALTTSDAHTVYGNGTSVVAPTSSNFTLGAYAGVNGSGTTFVAYCFAEVAGFSKFGSYTGNGSTDGPFVYCGFRPKYVLIKRTDTTYSWFQYDSARDTYNPESNYTIANGAQAEQIYAGLDFLSGGFKFRNTALDLNASGGTYIFMAFAEAPFKNALAR